jgi:hypothetical protein
MDPFSLLLASLLSGIIVFGGSVLISMVLLERPMRKGADNKPKKLRRAAPGPAVTEPRAGLHKQAK